jgi:transcriptional regulator with XRE-family HTH domain
MLKRHLKDLREKAGLSVREAAARLEKSPGYLSRIEGRGEIPSAEFLCEMASLYGGDVDEVLELAKKARLKATEQQIVERQSEALRLFRKKRGDS